MGGTESRYYIREANEPRILTVNSNNVCQGWLYQDDLNQMRTAVSYNGSAKLELYDASNNLHTWLVLNSMTDMFQFRNNTHPQNYLTVIRAGDNYHVKLVHKDNYKQSDLVDFLIMHEGNRLNGPVGNNDKDSKDAPPAYMKVLIFHVHTKRYLAYDAEGNIVALAAPKDDHFTDKYYFDLIHAYNCMSALEVCNSPVRGIGYVASAIVTPVKDVVEVFTSK